MAIYLTEGAVARLANGDVTTDIQMKPVLHVLQTKIFMPDSDRERAKLWLTDGVDKIEAMLLNPLTSLVKDKTFGPGNIIQLLQFKGVQLSNQR